MKKVLERIAGAWRKAASWLAKWGADRWMHLVAGLVIAFVTGCLASGERWQAGLVGLLSAFIIGFLKEVGDALAGDRGDLVDLLFTTLGGAVGYGLMLIAAA